MSSRTTIQPKETKNLDIYGLSALEWERVLAALDGTGKLCRARGLGKILETRLHFQRLMQRIE